MSNIKNRAVPCGFSMSEDLLAKIDKIRENEGRSHFLRRIVSAALEENKKQ